MPTIKRVTNPNKLVEEKVNYFLDQMTHASDYAGRHWFCELETPITLLEKILFRIKNHIDFKGLPYFDNYFNDPFFTGGKLWNTYKTYDAVKTVVTKYNSLTNRQKDDKIAILTNSSFHNNLELLLRDLRYKMFRDLVDGVHGNIVCNHTLDELVPDSVDTHAASLKNLAYTLVSAYIFKGYTRTEIREVISNVFNRDIDKFPFPQTVKTKTDRKKHVAKRDLRTQLHGFTNAYEQPTKVGKVIIKVFGGVFPESFEFKYNTVAFYGKQHPFIIKLKQKMQSVDSANFFVDGEYIIAIATISWHSANSLLDNVVQKVRGELIYLSACLGRNFNVDNTSNYILLSTTGRYQGMSWSSRRFDNPISEYELDILNDNAYHVLRKYNGIAIDWFLKYESVFLQAYMNRSIPDYWLYLETLLSYKQVEKKVMSIVSSIILTNEELFRNNRLLSTIRACFNIFSGGFNLLNVTQDRRRKIISLLQKGKLTKEIRNVDYPFIKEMVHDYDSKIDNTSYQKAKEYYTRILKEAYEYRNFALHSGLENQAAKDKLVATLPSIAIRLRWAFFKALKNGDHDTPFDLLIEKLVREGELLLTE